MNSDNREAAYFRELSDRFYKQNFGQMSKQEVELFMFHVYINELRLSKQPITDYRISKELGITQQRVRNLRVKEQLVYKAEIDWKKELATCIENAKYEAPYIVIDIPDPNVMIEVRNYLEEHGKYSDIRINSRLLTVRVDFFLDLVLEVEGGNDKGKIFKELKRKIKSDNEYNNIDMDPIVSIQGLVKAGVSVATILSCLSGLQGGMISALSGIV